MAPGLRTLGLTTLGLTTLGLTTLGLTTLGLTTRPPGGQRTGPVWPRAWPGPGSWSSGEERYRRPGTGQGRTGFAGWPAGRETSSWSASYRATWPAARSQAAW